MELPDIKTLDWIRVGSHDCVVRVIYSDNSQSGLCQAVLKKINLQHMMSVGMVRIGFFLKDLIMADMPPIVALL